ncbi:MAG: FIST C-terminal domain-containing protein [Oscillospiraceae bacterium]|jgi:hypothetical protein|nr:FIST C-terminal domain-containing protein [Oscillospiraceae bacterium]
MIKVYTAFTSQVDDPQAAAKEILEQLKPEQNMLKNTVGLTVFYNEYLDSGAYQAVTAALPFDLVGGTTTFSGSCGESGEFSLAVTMLTSDDVEFRPETLSIKDKTNEEVTAEVTDLYSRLQEKEKPKMVFICMSANPSFSGDDLVDLTNEVTTDIPLFGSFAWNTTGSTDKSFVTLNDTVSTHLMAFIAFYGDFKPRFQVTTSLDVEKLVRDLALITDAEGPILKTVNDIPALEYLRKLGLVKNNEISLSQLYAVPSVVVYENGVRVVRAILDTVKDDPSSVLVAGNMPVGEKISFALLDADETIQSSADVTAFFEREGIRNTINYSCAARSWSLGSKYFAELEKFADYNKRMSESSDKPVNYIMSYSASEICPVPDKDGNLINCLHNYTLISCILDEA